MAHSRQQQSSLENAPPACPSADASRVNAGPVEDSPRRARTRFWFHEYFNGDNGAGLGASHQTGWTALVAKLIQQQGEFGTIVGLTK